MILPLFCFFYRRHTIWNRNSNKSEAWSGQTTTKIYIKNKLCVLFYLFLHSHYTLINATARSDIFSLVKSLMIYKQFWIANELTFCNWKRVKSAAQWQALIATSWNQKKNSDKKFWIVNCVFISCFQACIAGEWEKIETTAQRQQHMKCKSLTNFSFL